MDDNELREKYWTGFMEYALKTEAFTAAFPDAAQVEVKASPYISFKEKIKGFSYQVDLLKRRKIIRVRFYDKDKSIHNYLGNRILKDAKLIEQELAGEWKIEWVRPTNVSNVVEIRLNIESDFTDQALWESQYTREVEALLKLHDTIQPYIEKKSLRRQ